jgi:hypothetical protein
VIEWFLWVQLAVAVAGGTLAIILGLVGWRPNDLTMGFAGVVELLLIVQLAVTISAPLTGNQPTGSLIEFYLYLVTALLIPLGAAFWAIADRSRWSTVVLGVAMLAIAVMLYRMSQIWFLQGDGS